MWPRLVTVSTLDSESSDRGANPREAFLATPPAGLQESSDRLGCRLGSWIGVEVSGNNRVPGLGLYMECVRPMIALCVETRHGAINHIVITNQLSVAWLPWLGFETAHMSRRATNVCPHEQKKKVPNGVVSRPGDIVNSGVVYCVARHRAVSLFLSHRARRHHSQY